MSTSALFERIETTFVFLYSFLTKKVLPVCFHLSLDKPFLSFDSDTVPTKTVTDFHSHLSVHQSAAVQNRMLPHLRFQYIDLFFSLATQLHSFSSRFPNKHKFCRYCFLLPVQALFLLHPLHHSIFE